MLISFRNRHESHSIIHNPASVYDQLLTEYGLLGIVVFAVYYIGFSSGTLEIT